MLRRLFGARKVPLISSLRSAANCRLFSTNESAPQRNDRTAQDSPFQISAAMNLFLQTHRKNQQFLQSRKAEYERGKEYLAKMMDLDKSCLDKEAIQTAIDYLFPSELFDKPARPRMPDPDDIYENYDQLNIDLKGRPSDLFFYTGKPKFFRTLFNIRTEVNRLMEKTELAEHDSKINSETIRYLSLQEFRELHIGEYLNEKEYRQFALLMNRFILLNDRFDTRSDEKMLKYFKLYVNEETKFTLPKIFYDKESGRNFTSISSSKKHSKVCVTVYEKGTGKFIINNKHDLLYFKNYQRPTIIAPLVLSKSIGKVDIYAHCESNIMCSATSLRSAISYCLASLSQDEYIIELFRHAGLLCIDGRRRERKKAGQKGARAKYPWRKR